MGQYFNSSGLKVFAEQMRLMWTGQQIFNPFLAQKDLKDVSKVDWSLLKSKNIKYVIFDKDNTLTEAYKDDYFSEEIKSSVEKCQEIFGYKNVAVLSNSVGSKDDPQFRAAKAVTEEMQIEVILHPKFKKPEVWDDIVTHFKNEQTQ